MTRLLSIAGSPARQGILLLLAGLFLSGCGGGGGSGDSSATVPNVVGNSQSAAETAISGAGLVLGTVSTQSSASVTSGLVISESPAAGASVPNGSSVSLVISSGPILIGVPNVVGDSQSAATTAITGAGLVVGTVTMQNSATVPSGNVVSESPAAGTNLSSGSAVDLVVSSGPLLTINYKVSFDAVNDAVWEPNQKLLYLAIGSTGPICPNCVIGLDPESGTIVSSAQAGSEPSTLAVSDDGQFLYVGLRGANAIQRFSLPALVLNLTFQSDADEFTPGSSGGLPLFAQEMAVAPGAPHTLAVARSTSYGSIVPYGYSNTAVQPGVTVVFDDISSRPYPTAATPAANSLAWGADAGTLFTGFNLAQGTQVNTLSTAAGAFVLEPGTGAMPGTFPDVIEYEAGLIYDNSGSVLDPVTSQIVQSYPGAAGFVTPDSVNNRVFYATVSNGTFTLSAYNLSQSTLIGTAAIPGSKIGGTISRMIRWGVDGLAVVTAQGYLGVLWGTLIAPGGTDTPVGIIPGSSPSYSGPAAKSVVPTVSILTLQATDVAWDSIHGLLYAAIPSTATQNPGTIAIIDPATGQVTANVPTTMSPGPLALSDDGQYLYVGEHGAYERFLLPAVTLNATIPGGTYWGTAVPISMAVAPGSPRTLAVSFTGVSVLFNDTGQVGVPVHGGPTIWGPNAATAYALDSSVSSGTIYNFSVDPSGFTQTAIAPEDRFVTLSPSELGMGMYYADGLLYADTGGIVDPQTGQTVGTLSLAGPSGATYAVGPIAVDAARHRAYSMSCVVFPINGACGNELISFDLTTEVPIVFGEVFGFAGYAFRLLEMSPSSFAALAPNGDIALVRSPDFAL